MKFTATAAGSTVPAGSYDAKFKGIEEFNEGEYGPGVRLLYEVTSGEHAGEIASRICSQKFSSKSNLFKFAGQLRGTEVSLGEDFDFAEFVGTTGKIMVETTANGESTRVSMFLKT